MSAGEELYVGMVIVAFVGFGLVLAAVSFIERRWAKSAGKS